MFREKTTLLLFLISILPFVSCGQTEEIEKEQEQTADEPIDAVDQSKAMHAYGGWYCPDNFGFPPVDIQDLSSIPVVNDRLPTKEETRNGTSLMYIDITEIPDARPLVMELPRLARIYSKHNQLDEIIIVIQALVAGTDTVVGFRYPNGGNGSAWYNEVSFLSDEEVDKIEPSPFVYFKSEIKASKADVWQAITESAYAKGLGKRFSKEDFFSSSWSDEAMAQLNYESDSMRATGSVSSVFGNLYLHIDYDYNGFHYSEKILAIYQEEKNSSELHIAAGPFPKNFDTQNAIWDAWQKEVKAVSER